jgi:hypothetical protein
MSDDLEYELRINMSHNQQVSQFGWCMCEGTGHITEGCPVEEMSNV